LSREKPPDLAIEALRVMHRGGRPARLVVAGSGPLTASLRRRAQGLPVELVEHLAHRSSVADLLGAAVKGDAGRTAMPEPRALATAIVGLLAVPEPWRRGAARARAESFPWSRTTDTMLALHGLAALVSPLASERHQSG
jgi:alpha-1,6-mannosyltransferase